MANELNQSLKAQIREVYFKTRSIKAATRESGVSRNTIRKLLRSEGLSLGKYPSKHLNHAPGGIVTHNKPSEKADLSAVDFEFLERLFELGKDRPETLNFKDHVLKLTKAVAVELGISTTTDQLRLQCGIEQMLIYRRFYMKSLKASDQSYEGPFVRAHDKLARAVDQWTLTSHRALELFLRILRELEVRNGKMPHDFGRNNVFVNQSEIHLQQNNV